MLPADWKTQSHLLDRNWNLLFIEWKNPVRLLGFCKTLKGHGINVHVLFCPPCYLLFIVCKNLINLTICLKIEYLWQSFRLVLSSVIVTCWTRWLEVGRGVVRCAVVFGEVVCACCGVVLCGVWCLVRWVRAVVCHKPESFGWNIGKDKEFCIEAADICKPLPKIWKWATLIKKNHGYIFIYIFKDSLNVSDKGLHDM